MIQEFSPRTRRIVAIGILVLLALLAVQLSAAVARAVSNSLDELEESRFRLARLEAIRARPAAPPPRPIPEELTFQAASYDEAAAQALAAVNAAAASAQLVLPTVSALPRDEANPNLIRISVAGSAPEQAVLTFIGEIEKASPAVRLRSWNATAAEGQPPALIFEGVAVAAWGGAR